MSGSLFDLTGKVALITGGHKGLGRGITNALAEAGADIVVVSRHVTDEFLDEMKQYGVVCRKYNYDISESPPLGSGTGGQHYLPEYRWFQNPG